MTLVNTECHMLSPVHVGKIVKLADWEERCCSAMKNSQTVQGSFMV